MPPNRFESEVESFLEGSHGDRTHIKRADHHTVTPLCGTLLRDRKPHEKHRRLTTFVTTHKRSARNRSARGPCDAHGLRRGFAAVPVGNGVAWPRCRWAVAGPGQALRRRAKPHISNQASLVWRAPEGPEGTGGLRGAAPNEVRTPSLAGGRALRRPEHPWGNKHQHAARTTRGRAAAHGHTQQPDPTAGPSGARNTRGATSHKQHRDTAHTYKNAHPEPGGRI